MIDCDAIRYHKEYALRIRTCSSLSATYVPHTIHDPTQSNIVLGVGLTTLRFGQKVCYSGDVDV